MASGRFISGKVGSSDLPYNHFSVPINLESSVFQIPKGRIGEVYPVGIGELERLVPDLLERPSDQRLFRNSPLLHGIQHGSQFSKDNLAGNSLYLTLIVLATAAFDYFQDKPLDFGVLFDAFEKYVS